MPYVPQTETNTLKVYKGIVLTLEWTAGSTSFTINTGGPLTAADVGATMMVLSGLPFGLTNTTWTTLATQSGTAGTTADPLPDGNPIAPNVNPFLYTAVLYRLIDGATNYLQSGSVEVDLSITNRSTAQFTLISRDGSEILPLGTPIMIIDTEVGVEYFGGTVDENQVTNEPGSGIVYSTCKCVGWDLIMERRTTQVSDAATDGDTTYGATNPALGQFFNLRADQILTYWATHAFGGDGVTLNLDTSGPQLPTFSSIGAKISDALDQLVAASTPTGGTPQFQWFVSPRRVLNLVKTGSTAAPWNISDADASDQNVLIQVQNTLSRQNYFNRGTTMISEISESFFGSQLPTPPTTFFLQQTIPVNTSSVSMSVYFASAPQFGFIPQIVGVGGVDVQKQWYYLPGTPNVAQQIFVNRGAWSSSTTYNIGDYVQFGGQNYSCTANGNKNIQPDVAWAAGRDWRLGTTLGPNDILQVSFPIALPFAYDALDAEAAQASVESGSGIAEAKINLNALNTVTDAETFVISMVEQAKDYSQQIQIETYKPGLNIGQTIQINLTDIGVNSNGSPALGARFLIDSVKITTDGNRKLFTVTASIDAPIVGGWPAQLKRGLGTAGGVNAHPLAIPLSGAAIVANIGAGGLPTNINTGGTTTEGPYDVALTIEGTPIGGAGSPPVASELFRFVFTEQVNFDPNFARSEGSVQVNPTGTQTWTVSKNGSSIGTVVISTAGKVTFTTSGAVVVQFNAGDVLTVTGSTVVDATLAGVSVVFRGTPTSVSALPIQIVTAQYVGGPVPAGQICSLYTFPDPVTFNANWAYAYGSCGTNPTSTAVFTIYKNGVQVGTATISTSGVFTFATNIAGSPAVAESVTYSAGDVLMVKGPTISDATLANVAFSLQGKGTGYVELGGDLGNTTSLPAVIGVNLHSAAIADDAGAANAYSVTTPFDFTLAKYAQVTFLAGAANTGPATLNVNGLGAIAIKKGGSLSLALGDISAGQIVTVFYDGTNWQMLSATGSGAAVPRKFSSSWTSQTSVTVTHNLGTTAVLVQVFDGSGNLVQPQNIAITSANAVTLTFGANLTGSVIVIGLGSNPTTLVYTLAFTSQTSVTVTHNLGTTQVGVQVFDASGNKVIPQSIAVNDVNTVTLGFGVSFSGTVVIAAAPPKAISTYTTSWSSQTSVTISHGLGTTAVYVQVFDNGSPMLEVQPQSVVITDANTVTLGFGASFSGSAVIFG